jgi:hypothetical protein
MRHCFALNNDAFFGRILFKMFLVTLTTNSDYLLKLYQPPGLFNQTDFVL